MTAQAQDFNQSSFALGVFSSQLWPASTAGQASPGQPRRAAQPPPEKS
ncbi:MAG: hypothetical protein LBR11_02555 [Deltaproteobacteria bacterium]|nr:hypothetical protein [Deltaproteobacteria bacterium]